jgi:MFS family permease
MQRAAQAWLIWELTDRALYLGLVAACATLPMLLLSLPAGVLADRLRKRNVLLVTQSLGAVQAFSLAVLIHTGAIQVWHVMALAAFLGTVWAFDMPTRHAMVLELVSKEDALNAISLNSSAFNCGRLIGPAVAGLLMAKVGFAVCFAANGLTFLALVAALATIRPRPPASTERNPMLLEIGKGLRWARSNTVAFALLAMIAVSSLYGLSYVVLLPVMAEQVFRVGPEGYGFLMSAHAAGALCVAFLLTTVGMGPRWPLGRLVTAGSLCFPVALMAVAVANSYLAGMFGLFFTGAGMMAFHVVAGMAWLGDVQMGTFGEWFGVRAAILIGASVCLLAAAAAWWRVPELRRSD